jgi:hypothetical protein
VIKPSNRDAADGHGGVSDDKWVAVFNKQLAIIYVRLNMITGSLVVQGVQGRSGK